MKGYLYNIIDDYGEYLYWSIDEVEDKIEKSYKDYLENANQEESTFEEWFNNNFVAQIERVFLTNIFV